MIDAEFVKKLRYNKGWTQKDLADFIGVSLRTVTSYELGGVIPKAKQLLLETIASNNATTISGDGNIIGSYAKLNHSNNRVDNKDAEILALKNRIKELESDKEFLKNLVTNINNNK